jgi:hypothetical protein
MMFGAKEIEKWLDEIPEGRAYLEYDRSRSVSNTS